MSITTKSFVAVLLLLMSLGAAGDSIVLHALFKDKAIVVIEGTRRVLTIGTASPEGVKLLKTDTRAERAEIEWRGQRETLPLGTVRSGFAPSTKNSATLWAEPDGHFYAAGSVNGVAVRFMVDTGATTIAMNSTMAARIGIDYKKRGRAGAASTASGVVRTYEVRLDNVQVGGITLHNVEAGIIEGNFPREALLGMSFLGQLDMNRSDNKMELTQR